MLAMDEPTPKASEGRTGKMSKKYGEFETVKSPEKPQRRARMETWEERKIRTAVAGVPSTTA